MDHQRLTLTPVDDGAFWRVTIGGSKGNILDASAVAALTDVFRRAEADSAVKALVLEGAGSHFSFGASVQEHLPDAVEAMFGRFREMLFAIVDSSVIVLAAVRGRCLGGGLEVVTLAHRIFAHVDATLGQPEITLGVFAPAASVLLPERVGRAAAEDLCLTGRSIDAREGAALGLIDEIVEGDPAEAALAWARTHLTPKSATSLRFAVRAVRSDLSARLKAHLPPIERLYLRDLMSTPDAAEGLHAFLEKRPAHWSRP